MKIIVGVILLTFIYLHPAFAHPEFQRYSKEVSGRSINCAICHMHSDGPEGLKPGQIGSLNQDELNALGLARQAFKPGAGVKSPILNEFGNSMLNQLGKEQILVLKQHPELLAGLLSKTDDLDGDGIMDAQEFLDGTHPLNSIDGLPGKLFKNNLLKNRFHILMIVLATFLGLFGLRCLILWLLIKVEKEKQE
ncbi:MAG: hypothetical protein KBD53_04780 [Candidatus Omnitrophica bacterium]|nr:hypothetical protein [Candidatus Omnitrophota bacterium]